ncbi:MAG: SoxY-related AACIE arm protein [Rhizobacter sp.]
MIFLQRRNILQLGLALGSGVVVRPAFATAAEMQDAIRGYANGAPVRTGRVKLDVSPIVENGNAVPITVSVESAMTADDHVTGIAVFNDRNPERNMVKFVLGPRSGRAVVSTRIRLATSQQLAAVARMSDGSCWLHTVDVLVTLSACLE